MKTQQGVLPVQLPPGPKGAVAREIYQRRQDEAAARGREIESTFEVHDSLCQPEASDAAQQADFVPGW